MRRSPLYSVSLFYVLSPPNILFYLVEYKQYEEAGRVFFAFVLKIVRKAYKFSEEIVNDKITNLM